MAKVIKLRKGLDINLKGKPTKETIAVKSSAVYGLVPDDFVGMTPKVVVKEQAHVQAGEALFVDKKHPEVKVVSPVSGTVVGVDRGERRKVLAVRVQADKEQSVAKMTAEEVKSLLLEAVLFALFMLRPYDIVAAPETTPKAIFISAFDSAPLAPCFQCVLNGQEEDFQLGLDALAKIAPVNLGVNAKHTAKALTDAKGVTVTLFDGAHPAGNVGVQIHHVNPINKGEIVWTIGAEEVIFIGRLLRTGKVDFTRTIALAGSEVKTPGYAKVVLGAQISDIVADRVATDKVLRIINGNVLTGKVTTPDGFLAAKATAVTVIPEGSETHEMFGWILPRLKDFSVNRSYFSWLQCGKKEYTQDARVKGSVRHMIMSGEYDRVLPMDILPEYLIKAILTADIDRMEALGIYEVAPEDFALCEYVDSSKLELQRIVREGLDALRAEMD